MSKTDKDEILFVEDNPNELELVLRVLKKYKISNKVVTVKDGISALQYLFSGENNTRTYPSVIFLDLKMPRIDGVDVLRRIKSDERISHIPVVILTSSEEKIDMTECYKLGANSYIIKPVEFSKFVECITKMVLYWLVWNKTTTGP